MSTDTIPLPNSKPRANRWGWLLVYLASTMVIQWPLVCSLSTHISYGHEQEITVPLLNLWTVWWNADRALEGFRDYWNAPIFFPTKNTFIFSEAQPTSLIVAPILWLTGRRALAYNVYQLLILMLNGFSAHCLLRRIGHLPWLAFCGGIMSQILPFVMWQFGVVQLTTLFGIFWTLQAVLDLFEIGTIQRRSRIPVGIRLGLAYGLTYWLCNYWGLFLTLLLLPCSICFANHRLIERSFWKQVLLASLLALLMIGPFAWLQHSSSRRHQWARAPELVTELSAKVRDHTDVPWKTLTPWLEFPDKWALGGGSLKLILVPFGVLASLLVPGRRRWGLFSLLVGLLAFGLSLGNTVQISPRIPVFGEVCPYELLQKYVPGMSLIRSPFRFSLFVQLAAVWLSIEALDLLNPVRWKQQTWWQPVSRYLRLPSLLNGMFGLDPLARLFAPTVLPLLLVSSLVTLEAIPPATRLFELPSRQGLPVWVVWLRDHAEPKSGIACLPFPMGDQVGDYEQTTIWMYWSTYHRRPLVNGYSGFFPDDFFAMKQELSVFRQPVGQRSVATPPIGFKYYAAENLGLSQLNQSPASYIVMQRSFGTRDDVWSNPLTRFRWALVLSDEAAQIDIYEIQLQE